MYTFTVDGEALAIAALIFAFVAFSVFIIKTVLDHNKDMKLIDQTAIDRKKLLRFMYMDHLPEDLAQKLKDEFNAVPWEIHQDCIKNYGTANHLYPTFVKTYEWILK